RFGGWFRRIVTNIAILRFRQRRLTISFEAVSNIYSHNEREIRYNYYDTLSRLDQFEDEERADKLDAAISALPQTYRQVIMMFYFDAQSYKEIATELGISVAALKSRLYRAKEKLKKEMLKNE
ncbi:RNA polymerase sigma factor, partial [Candidatus Poribacteria bacterium]|nr:RNA polymerase sigma factor [Candidatus Poribacteria bacterium]